MTKKITVLLPIRVPEGKYCWFHCNEALEDGRICEHFNNEGGHNTCEIGFSLPWKSERCGVLKPEACLKLKESS